MDVASQNTFVLQFLAFLILLFPKSSCRLYPHLIRRMEFPLLFSIHMAERQMQRDRDGASAAKYYSEGVGERESLSSLYLTCKFYV